MKILIIRLSSFGDVIQALPCVDLLQSQFPTAKIDWLIRDDAKDLVAHHPQIHSVYALDRKSGLREFFRLILLLRQQNYTHIYDAHNNLRSHLLRACFFIFHLLQGKTQPQILVRSKNRWKRFLFFKLRKPVFKMPYPGALSYISPLQSWCSTPIELSKKIHLHLPPKELRQWNLPESYIALVPSAAWATKRWPIESWIELIRLLPEQKFIVLGGPQDTFCKDLENVDSKRVQNFAGKTSLIESCQIIKQATLVISGDTGLLHAADQMLKQNIGLIGPTAFGYTSQPSSKILETQLPCKPCSKDGRNTCTNAIYQKCMKDISPKAVAQLSQKILGLI